MPSRIERLSSQELADRVSEIAARIKGRRKAMGVSASAASEAAGMSRVTWHRIESGQTSVTIGAWFNALAVLGLEFDLGDRSSQEAVADPSESGAFLPVSIRVGDYSQLEALAWQLSPRQTLTPQEAWDIYRRNRRHLDESTVSPRERALITALQSVFGQDC